MGVESDKLRELIDVIWPQAIIDANNAVTKLQEQEVELGEQIDSVEWMMGEAETEQTAALVAKGYDHNYYGPDYGDTDLSDWILSNDLTAISYVDPDTFSTAGDTTLIYTAGLVVLVFGSSGEPIKRTVASSSYDGMLLVTTVVLSAGDAIPATANFARSVQYEYLGIGWDSDAGIISRINLFATAYDHLNLDLGLSGTYGLYDMLSKIGDGIALQQANAAKFQQFIDDYEGYAT